MSFLAQARNRPKYRALPQVDFGGLMNQYEPLVPRRAAVISENVNYDSRVIAKANGDVAVLENAVGAVQIEDFNSDTGWTGGLLETGSDNYVATEAADAGVASRRLVQIGIGTATMDKSYSPPLVLGLPPGEPFDGGFDEGFGGDLSLVERPLDLTHLWRKPVVFTNTVTGYQVRLRFETSTGNHFEAVVAGTGAGEEKLETSLESEFTTEFDESFMGVTGIGLYRRIRRFEFVKTGSPTWESIAKIRINLQITAGTGTLAVVFDNLYRSPGYVQDLFQFRRFQAPLYPSRQEFAVAGGKLFKNDGLRWAEVFSGFDAERPVTGITLNSRRFVTDGTKSPIKIMPGGTIYRMGIANPPKQISLAQIGGGSLADQQVYVKVKWYSTITGIESGVDDPEDGKLLIITGSGGIAAVRVSNLPVSTDPQVTHVRIFIRPANLSDSEFFRASGGADGEAANGILSFDITEPITNLSQFDVMDPDTDYPSVIVGGVQVEGHPMFFVEVGGFVLTVMAEYPNTLRSSSFDKPENWPLDSEIELGLNDDDEITGLSSGQDVALAFKRDAIYPIRVVNTAIGPVASGSISERGSVSHKAIVRIGDQLWFPNEDGVYWLDPGLRLRRASGNAQPAWDGLWDPNQARKMVGVELRGRFQYHLFGASLGQLSSDRDWVTHYPRQERARYQREPEYDPSIHTAGADAATTLEDSADLQRTWVARNGMVYQVDTGVARDGRGFLMRHRTGIWSPDGGAGAWVCRWPWVDIIATITGDVDVAVGVFLGPVLVANATPSAHLQGDADVLSEFVLGTSKLGAASYVHQRLKLPMGRARFLQMEFSHDGRGEVEILSVMPHYLVMSQKGAA